MCASDGHSRNVRLYDGPDAHDEYFWDEYPAFFLPDLQCGEATPGGPSPESRPIFGVEVIMCGHVKIQSCRLQRR